MAIASAFAMTGAHADFTFDDFADTSGLNLVGDSLISQDTLILTEAIARSAGGVWFDGRKQRVAQGFETTFVFGAKDVTGLGADGIAFVIQNTSPEVLGGTGGAMGYGTNRFFNEPGIANSLAVEIDLWDNSREGDWPDLNDTHLSVQTNGLLPNDPSEAFSLGAAPIIPNVDDQQPHVARIVYDGSTMSVFIDDLLSPALVVNDLDLSSTLQLDNGSAWVGITGATGRPSEVQSHLIFSWDFAEPVPGPSAGLVIMLGVIGIATRRRR